MTPHVHSYRARYDVEPGSIEVTQCSPTERIWSWIGGDVALVSDELVDEVRAYDADGMLPWYIEWGPRDPERHAVYVIKGEARPLDEPQLVVSDGEQTDMQTCVCGHLQGSHEDGDGICYIHGCDCERFRRGG